MILLVREQFTLPLSILKLKEGIRQEQRVGDDNGKFSIPLISPSFPFTDSVFYENLLLSRLILTTPKNFFPIIFLIGVFPLDRNVCEMKRTMRKRVARSSSSQGDNDVDDGTQSVEGLKQVLYFFRQIIKKNDVHGLCITAKSK